MPPFHKFVPAPDGLVAVNIWVWPTHKLIGPAGDIVGVIGVGVMITGYVKDVLEHPLLFVIVTE